MNYRLIASLTLIGGTAIPAAARVVPKRPIAHPAGHSAAVSRANRPPTAIEGTIDKNTTLDLAHSPYVSNGFTVSNNATLTIEHGVVIKFNQGATVSIGWSDPGFLIAKGVKTLPGGKMVPDPIHFLATLPNPTHGYWGGVRIVNSQYRSVLDHVDISNAGSDAGPALKIGEGNAPTVTNCNISWGDGVGVEATGKDTGFTKFDGNTISHFPGLAMDASVLAAGGITSNNQLIDNGKNYIQVGGGLAKDSHWTNNKWPFVVSSPISVQGDNTKPVTFSIGPGVKLMFSEGAGLGVGWGDSTGILLAQGTADQPVVFTSSKPTPIPGSWDNISFHTGGKSVMDYCVVEFAGGTDHSAAIHVEGAQPSITNCVIRNGSGPGVQGDGDAQSYFLAFKGNTITGMQGVPIIARPNFIPGLDPDNKLTGNADDVISIEGGDLATDMVWHRHDVPYFFHDNLTIAGSGAGGETTLTLDPGVHMVFDDDRMLNVGWSDKGSLKAIGTPDQPIVFSSHEKVPGKGDWGGLSLGKSGSNTDLEYIEVDYAGKKDGDPPIRAGDDSRGKISHYTIAHSAAGGISMGKSRITQDNGTFTDVDGDQIKTDQ